MCVSSGLLDRLVCELPYWNWWAGNYWLFVVFVSLMERLFLPLLIHDANMMSLNLELGRNVFWGAPCKLVPAHLCSNLISHVGKSSLQNSEILRKISTTIIFLKLQQLKFKREFPTWGDTELFRLFLHFDSNWVLLSFYLWKAAVNHLTMNFQHFHILYYEERLCFQTSMTTALLMLSLPAVYSGSDFSPPNVHCVTYFWASILNRCICGLQESVGEFYIRVWLRSLCRASLTLQI